MIHYNCTILMMSEDGNMFQTYLKCTHRCVHFPRLYTLAYIGMCTLTVTENVLTFVHMFTQISGRGIDTKKKGVFYCYMLPYYCPVKSKVRINRYTRFSFFLINRISGFSAYKIPVNGGTFRGANIQRNHLLIVPVNSFGSLKS